MILYPNAKINLGLNVIRKREDGFHELQTLFYPVKSLFDILEIEKSEKFSIEIEGADWPAEKDLCAKAFHLMQERYGIGEVKIRLKKQIATGAGLGGGSADCAFTIKALNELFELGLAEKEMEEVAGELGSDCAFFIKNRPQWGEGRGEILSEAQDFLKDYEIVVEMPQGEKVSTAQAYSKIKPRQKSPSVREILSSRRPEEWKGLLENDFEESVFPEHPKIAQLKEKMYEKGAVYASMSGSGAAVFGIFSNLAEK